MKIKFNEVIKPRESVPVEGQTLDWPGPTIPTSVTMDVVPTRPYAGQFGELPFQDPWWKIFAWVVAAIAALVSIIAAAVAAKGGKKDMTGFVIGGKFDETTGGVECCKPDPEATGKLVGVKATAGIAATVAAAAAAVGWSDAEDPWYRGQRATIPGPGELTVAESVHGTFAYPAPPRAGSPYEVDVDWTYTRRTTGGSYSYSVRERQRNIHVIDRVEIEAPPRIEHLVPDFIVQARVYRDERTRFTGEDLYVYAAIVSPTGVAFALPLTDDGLLPDTIANDGTYTGRFDLIGAQTLLRERGDDIFGVWRVHVYAQDINDARPGMPPVEAAGHIGGAALVSPVQFTFDGAATCPLRPHAVVEVA